MTMTTTPLRAKRLPSAVQLDHIEAAQARIEQKLDALLAALAAEGDVEDPAPLDLDGNPCGAEREAGTPL